MTILKRSIQHLNRWLDVRLTAPETQRRQRMLNIVLVALLAGAILGIGRARYRAESTWLMWGLIGTVIVLYVLNRRGRTAAAGHLLVCLSVAISFTGADLLRHNLAVFLVIPILLAGVILGAEVGLAYGTGIVTLAIVTRLSTRPAAISWVETGLLSVAVLLMWLFSFSIDQAIRALSLRTVELEQANAALAAREKLRETFGQFVSPEVARAAVQRGVKLGGETVEASVFFTDICNFTGLSERLHPDQVVALLNRFFCAVVPIINLHKGLVLEFGGDSILAVFGTPVLPLDDHAIHTVRCALALRRALAEFNEKQNQIGEPAISIGIGISTGTVVAGHIGCEERLEYTVIGNNVNLASRLQQLTREWNADIVISEATYLATQDQIAARRMNNVLIRGRRQPITAYVVETA